MRSKNIMSVLWSESSLFGRLSPPQLPHGQPVPYHGWTQASAWPQQQNLKSAPLDQMAAVPSHFVIFENTNLANFYPVISILFRVIPVSASYCCFLDFSPERCSTNLELSTPIWCGNVKSVLFPWATLCLQCLREMVLDLYLNLPSHCLVSTEGVLFLDGWLYSFTKLSCMKCSWKIQFRGNIVKNSVSLYTLLSPHFFCHLTPIMGC